MWIEASAPSNIALIKYMGKLDAVNNRPTNVSVSYTLDHLRTYVRIKADPSLTADSWAAFSREDLLPIHLSEKGLSKYIIFFQTLKKEFRLSGFFRIESANNFPSDCGLASSASSYAALTKCAHTFYTQTNASYTMKELSKISQKGSGSSCRSFFSPWGLWHENGAEEIKLPQSNLSHMVILCDESVKSVSSSEAHLRVLTSDLFKGRPERANVRFHDLVNLLRNNKWKESFELCWNEFWDMHVLFHTARPAFMYMNEGSQKALADILSFWHKAQDGPLVTMDAGSNVHLLFREDQADMIEAYVKHFSSEFNLWARDAYKKRK